MKPLFVSIREGQRMIHWKKMIAVSVAVIALSVGLVEAIWWLVFGTLSQGALVLTLVVGVLVFVRLVARAVTYQERELEVTAEPM